MSQVIDEHHPEVIDRTVAQLQSGGCLVYPTDTIYGIGCDAMQPNAIANIRKIKGRESQKPFLVLAGDITTVTDKFRIEDFKENLEELWPGPYTVLLENTDPDLNSLRGDTGRVAVRVASDSFTRKLFRAWNGLLISTSANTSSRPYSHDWPVLLDQFVNKVDLLVKRKVYPIHPPSNIIEWKDDKWISHRGQVPSM